MGVRSLDSLRADAALEMLARLGVILLLFQVGLESTVGQMLSVRVLGPRRLPVAATLCSSARLQSGGVLLAIGLAFCFTTCASLPIRVCWSWRPCSPWPRFSASSCAALVYLDAVSTACRWGTG